MDILKCLVCIFCIITCFTRLIQASNPCQFFLENGQILENSHEFHVKSTTEIGYTVVTVKVTNADYVDFTNVNDPKVVYYFDLIPEKIDAFNQNILLKIRFPLTEIKEQYSSNRINGAFQCITTEGDITIKYFSILIDEDEKEPDSHPVFNANDYVYEVLENYVLSKDFTSSSIITVWTKRNSGLVFSFSSGNEDGIFGLKSVRWESSDVIFKYKINLYLKKSLDYEQKKHYTLKLQAVDISNSSFKTTVPLKIIVLDYDDMDPVFEYARYVTKVENFMLEQSAPVKLVVLPDPILAFDGDRGINAPLKYDIVNCSAFSSLLDIDEVKGTLLLLKPSDIKKIYQEWNVVIVRLMVNAVFSAGFLKIKFINFTYDTGLRCDYFSNCDFIFHICIDDKKGPEDNINVCRYFSVKTKELNDTVIYLKKLPDIVLLKFLILDDDSYRMEEIDFLHSYLNLIPGNTSQVILHNQTRISINFTVICKNNFFGPHCSKYCYVNDKDSQHFKCNHETGERECMTGWSGLSCNESIIFSTTENSSSYSYSKTPDAPSSDFSDLILSEEIANLESLIVSSSPSEIYNVSVLSMETQLSENDDYITEKPIFIKPEVMLEEFTEKKIISTLLEMETVPTKSTQNEEESSIGSSTNSWEIEKRIINMEDEKYMQLESGQNEIFADEHIHKRGYNLLLVNGSVGNLMTVIHDVLRHEVGDEVANKLIVDVGIWNGILKYTIFTRNESLPRTVMEHVQRLQPNIENALAHLISTHHEAAANKTSPKRKGIPEWGIVLVIIAMVTTAIIGIRQAHKHCGTKTSVKPKELMEEHDNPEAAPNALPNVPLNFTNPIYVQP